MSGHAIIIGASSGIGAELARQLAAEGYSLGLAARRVELLEQLATELPGNASVVQLDVTDPLLAAERFQGLADRLGSVDIVVISAGTGHVNPDLSWDKERDTIATNVVGFTAIATAAMRQLEQQGWGTLVGLSSLAAIRGNGTAPAYGASKAFVSHYLQALQHRVAKQKSGVVVIDIQAGFVDTAMAKGEGLFWVASPEEAARQIIVAIQRGRTHAYVTRRWRLIAWLLRLLPDKLYQRL